MRIESEMLRHGRRYRPSADYQTIRAIANLLSGIRELEDMPWSEETSRELASLYRVLERHQDAKPEWSEHRRWARRLDWHFSSDPLGAVKLSA